MFASHCSRRVLVATFVAIAACDGGSGDTGLSPDRTFADLDVPELEQACRAYYNNDYGLDEAEYRRWQCYVNGISLHEAAPFLFDCSKIASDCLSGMPTDDEDGSNQETCVVEDDFELPACADQVTIGDLEACMDALAARAQQLVDQISCATAPELVLAAPPACASFDAACPGLGFGK